MNEPALTIALALAAGMICQALARHIHIPGIVLLLLAGVLLGPDMANVVRPDTLGSGLMTIVGFAVAVILFEGGMNLQLQRLKREGPIIRKLITVGALVTAVGATLATKTILGWGWRPAILFGLLIPVTGPTVIAPLLRRIKVRHSIATILEAEGVFLDAFAAIIAAVALEIANTYSGAAFARGAFQIVFRIGLGGIIGLAGGFSLAFLLRHRNWVPEGLENVFTFSLVFALYQIANAILAESGIVAVTIAGIVIGNSKTVVQRELLEFKEHLTVMLIGLLFILLAADVRLADVAALGYRGAIVVLILITGLRPLSVWTATWKSELDWRRKLFLAWMGPRGIIAAAVASLFALELEHRGFGGNQLRALVFLVIAVTVLWAGLTGGVLARILGLRRKRNHGWVILGAHDLARTLGEALRRDGQEVLFIDSNPSLCRRAEADGWRVIYGNGLDENILTRAEIDTRAGVIGFTANEEVNLLFIQKAKQLGHLECLLIAVESGEEGNVSSLLEELGGTILGARSLDVSSWVTRLRRGVVRVETWTYQGTERETDDAVLFHDPELRNRLFPLAFKRKKQVFPVDNQTEFRKGDVLTVVMNHRQAEAASSWLRAHGFQPTP
jgi:NhaP-type Na+/H+ or K+/H+ antiporter